ncbi:PAS domain S-box protein (macronuclear) [Tetrahymena thermophila SB210]|uniref:PAS domain S-box protein n=1 Tax=Tetrahymena thermophila (strain SB210) TaxID=312017 RepID=W7XES4_TETTS|nr:PAS domain S-box protein [Tetrahymena thermophila SB210]EWS72421.1 PAS domain S-box protein [Tetrahymena thermophila SB210]|eukprot:XP_012655048.1 PAS domain S-box protein [Tetrahymena thermophila SB210]
MEQYRRLANINCFRIHINKLCCLKFQLNCNSYPFSSIDLMYSKQLIIQLFLGVSYISLGICIFMVCLIITACYLSQKKSKTKSPIYINLLKIISMYGILLNTILFLPLYNSFVGMVICANPNMTCFQGIYFLHLVFSVLGAVILISTTALFAFFQVDLNLFSKLCFARPFCLFNLINIGFKMIPPVIVALDKTQTSGNIVVIALLLTMILKVGYSFFDPGYYNSLVNLFNKSSQYFALWIMFSCFLCQIIGSDSISLLYVFLASPFFVLAMFSLDKLRNQYTLSSCLTYQKTVKEYFIFLNLLVTLIKDEKNEQSQLQLEGILKHHLRVCKKGIQDCCCRIVEEYSIIQDGEEGEEALPLQRRKEKLINDKRKRSSQKSNNLLPKNNNNYRNSEQQIIEATNQTEKPQTVNDIQILNLNYQNRWFSFLSNLLNEAIVAYPKSPGLQICYSYLLAEKLNNKTFSIYKSKIAKVSNNISIIELFCIFRQEKILEESMSENMQSLQIHNDNEDLIINQYVNFNRDFDFFQDQVIKAAKEHKLFWKELEEITPNISKLQKISKVLDDQNYSLCQMFNDLTLQNQNNINLLYFYGQYLNEITHDTENSSKVLQKAEQLFKQQNSSKIQLNNQKFFQNENSKNSIVIAFADSERMGEIIYSNQYLQNFLGFSKQDLLQKNVSMLMPPLISKKHSNLMNRFIQTSQSAFTQNFRIVPAVNKKGNLVPTNLLLKVIPEFNNGIQISGIMYEETSLSPQTYSSNKKFYYLIYRIDTLEIIQSCKNCFQDFGIFSRNQKQMGAKDIEIDLIMPQINDPFTITQLIEQPIEGVDIQIDSTQIKNMSIDQIDYEDSNANIQDSNNAITTEEIASFHQISGNKNNSNTKVILEETFDEQEDTMQTQNNISKYRKCQIRCYFIEDYFIEKGCTLRFIKFHETEQDLQNQNQQSNENTKIIENAKQMNSTQKFQSVKNRKIQNKNEETLKNEDYEENQQYKKQSMSYREDEEQQEDENQDFKQLIQEKRMPKILILLIRILVLSTLLLIALSSYKLYLNLQYIQYNGYAVDGIKYSYLTPLYITQATYWARQIWLVANQLRSPIPGNSHFQQETWYRQNLSQSINSLQLNQFQVISSSLQMNSLAGYDLYNANQNFSMANMLSNGTMVQQYEQYTDSIFKFITSSSNLVNATLDSFCTNSSTSSYTNPTQISFYYVKQNGVYELFEQAKNKAFTFYYYYINLNSNQGSFNLFVFVTQLVIIFITFCFITYVGNQIIKGNITVVSLFSYIPMNEIYNLANQCDVFIIKFNKQNIDGEIYFRELLLDEPNSKQVDGQNNNWLEKQRNKEISIFQESNQNLMHANSKLNANTPKLAGVVYGESPNLTFNSQLIPTVSRRNDDMTLNEMIFLNQKNQQFNQDDKNLNQIQQQIDKSMNEENQELEINRVSKFLNQKGERDSFMLLKQLFIASFFISLYFISYYLQLLYQQYSNNILTHYMYSSYRPINLSEYGTLFIEAMYFKYSIDKSRTYLTFNVTFTSYLNEKNMLSSFYWTYPSQLDTYRTEYIKRDSYNFCYYMTDITDEEKTNCENDFNGVNKRGLRSGIVSYLETLRDTLQTFEDSDASTQAAINVVADNYYLSLEDSSKYIIKCLTQNNKILYNAFQDYLKAYTQYAIILFVACILTILLIIIFMIKPFLLMLNNQIWKTRGMLNLIPVSIINVYPSLKKQFLASDLLFRKQ